MECQIDNMIPYWLKSMQPVINNICEQDEGTIMPCGAVRREDRGWVEKNFRQTDSLYIRIFFHIDLVIVLEAVIEGIYVRYGRDY